MSDRKNDADIEAFAAMPRWKSTIPDFGPPSDPASPRSAESREPFQHAYVHPGPQDCRDYDQCHDRAYREDGPGFAPTPVHPAPEARERETLRLHEWDFKGRTRRAVIGVRTANVAFHYQESDREAVEQVVALANAALLAPLPDDERLLDRALVAEALFEARIGIPQDTPVLADALLPPLLRLIDERRAELAALAPHPSEPTDD